MKYISLFAAAYICCSTAVGAQVTTYTSSADFHASNPGALLIEDFEDSDPALRETALSSYTGPRGEISFTPISSTPFEPNLWIDVPGHTDVASDVSPTSSLLLAVTGNEDFVGTLAAPAHSLGFDVMLNDWPLTLSFFNGDTLLSTLTFDAPTDPGNNRAFAGITSEDGVTSFRWQATNGQYWDTGIDNIFVAPAAVPEPSTWAMLLLGFGVVGLATRRKKEGRPSFISRSTTETITPIDARQSLVGQVIRIHRLSHTETRAGARSRLDNRAMMRFAACND